MQSKLQDIPLSQGQRMVQWCSRYYEGMKNGPDFKPPLIDPLANLLIRIIGGTDKEKDATFLNPYLYPVVVEIRLDA